MSFIIFNSIGVNAHQNHSNHQPIGENQCKYAPNICAWTCRDCTSSSSCPSPRYPGRLDRHAWHAQSDGGLRITVRNVKLMRMNELVGWEGRWAALLDDKEIKNICGVSHYFLSCGQWLRLGLLFIRVELHTVSPHVDVRLVSFLVRAILSVDWERVRRSWQWWDLTRYETNRVDAIWCDDMMCWDTSLPCLSLSLLSSTIIASI